MSTESRYVPAVTQDEINIQLTRARYAVAKALGAFEQHPCHAHFVEQKRCMACHQIHRLQLDLRSAESTLHYIEQVTALAPAHEAFVEFAIRGGYDIRESLKSRGYRFANRCWFRKVSVELATTEAEWLASLGQEVTGP